MGKIRQSTAAQEVFTALQKHLNAKKVEVWHLWSVLEYVAEHGKATGSKRGSGRRQNVQTIPT